MKVYISKKIPTEAKSLLEQSGYQVSVWNEERAITKEELISNSSDCDALISMLSDKIDSDFFTRCKKIKVVSNYAVGYNNIDVVDATKRKIAIGNTPDVLTEATADLALSLLLSISRKLTPAYQNVISGNWSAWEPLGFLGSTLRGKTLGIFGAGRIGQCMAKTCHQAFGMKIIYTSRTDKPYFDRDCNAKRVSFNELIKNSDVISLHSSLTDENKNLFNASVFNKMKKGSFFINTARGEMHNEEDLFHALRSGEIEAAALDVTNPEPMSKNSPLLKLDNFLVTPHIGSATNQARREMAKLVANNIINALEKRPLIGDVNNLYT